MQKLTDEQVKELVFTAENVLYEIETNKTCISMRQRAFNLPINDKKIQVQIIVTRDPDDFLDSEDLEITNNFIPNEK